MPPRRASGEPAGQPPAKKPALNIDEIRAKVAAQKEAVAARLASAKSGGAAPKPVGPAAPVPSRSAPTGTSKEDIEARIAEAKARINATKSRLGGVQPSTSGGRSGSGSASPAPPSAPTSVSGIGGVALHPLLAGDLGPSGEKEKNEKRAMANRYKTMAPKFSSVRANAAAVEAAQAQAEKSGDRTAAILTNPYTAQPTGEDGEEFAAGPSRRGRKMQFSAPGKYVRQGDQLRNEAKLEALKQRIAENSRKAGLDSEFDVLERSLKRQVPPAVEWWDEAILQDASYDDIPGALKYIEESPDSLVTHLVQHPIPIVAQSDRKQAERGLMLTKKEAKKMRRQRRLAELEDKRDKQKMGLIPPDPPKVRLANIVKVLANESTADPTKIENQVRKQVALRAIMHEKDNSARALTKEQRREKEYTKLAEKERRQGLDARAYIIRHLTNQRHKFKVRKTAQQDLLTGAVIFTPTFSLVLVEGVAKKVRHYHQLMTHRIDWTEQLRRRADSDEDSDAEPDAEGKAPEEDVDLSDNRCEMIWHAEVPERSFGGFIARNAETDSRAKDILGPKYELLWDLAKRWQFEGDDF